MRSLVSRSKTSKEQSFKEQSFKERLSKVVVKLQNSPMEEEAEQELSFKVFVTKEQK